MVRVRHAHPNDRTAWLEMRCALWPDGPSVEHDSEIDAFFAGGLRDPRAVLLAEVDGRIAGFAELSIRPYAEDCDTDRVAYLAATKIADQDKKVEAIEQWLKDYPDSSGVTSAYSTLVDTLLKHRPTDRAARPDEALRW